MFLGGGGGERTLLCICNVGNFHQEIFLYAVVNQIYV
jgi:hypothetical protein